MKIITPLLLILLLAACDNGGSTSNDFDRKAMLEHYGARMIQPAYEDLRTKTESMQTQVEAFVLLQEENTLTQARERWKEAYLSWQNANAFNFGPAGEEGIRKTLVEEIGVFPVSETKIEDRIAGGQWNLNDFERDARGFLAVEYLLFGKNQSNNEVIAAFAAGANRRQYLKELAADLTARTKAVHLDWTNYLNPFIQNDGTDVGSSTSLLYNEFVRSYESLKNFKVALPLGKRPGQTQPEPQLVEAYYSGLSRDFLEAHLETVEDIWYGRDNSGDEGPGFRAYLQSVEGGEVLIAQTEAQLSVVKNALAAVPTDQPLSELMAVEHPAVVTLNDELQKFTRFIKSDMSSLLGIAITFASGDGD